MALCRSRQWAVLLVALATLAVLSPLPASAQRFETSRAMRSQPLGTSCANVAGTTSLYYVFESAALDLVITKGAVKVKPFASVLDRTAKIGYASPSGGNYVSAWSTFMNRYGSDQDRLDGQCAMDIASVLQSRDHTAVGYATQDNVDFSVFETIFSRMSLPDASNLRAADRRIYEALISLADKRNITVPAGTNKAAAMFNEIATQCTNLRFRPIMFIECKPRSTAPGTTTSMNTCMDRLFGSYLNITTNPPLVNMPAALFSYGMYVSIPEVVEPWLKAGQTEWFTFLDPDTASLPTIKGVISAVFNQSDSTGTYLTCDPAFYVRGNTPEAVHTHYTTLTNEFAENIAALVTENTTSSYLFGRRHHLRAGPGASARRRLFTQDLAPENEDGGGGGGGGGGGPGDFKPPTSSASHIGPAMSWLLTLVVSTLVLLNALIH